MLSLTCSVQAAVRKSKTFSETWKTLIDKNGAQVAIDKMGLREQIKAIRMKKSSMIDDLAKFDDFLDQLGGAGGEISVDEIMLCLMRSLPKRFESMKLMLRMNELQKLFLSVSSLRLEKGVVKSPKREYMFITLPSFMLDKGQLTSI